MDYHLNNHHEIIQMSMKEIAPLWYKFRDAEPEKNTDLYLEYCERIQEAIWLNHTNDAFHLLVEGIEWYDSVNEA